MTTITRIDKIKAWIDGTLLPTRVKRKPAPPKPPTRGSVPTATTPAITFNFTSNGMTILNSPTINIDRFASYKEKIVPGLQDHGYKYFLACLSNEYLVQEEWCHDHATEASLPHCDVWQFDQQYPRAFKSETDAMLFSLTYDTTKIDTETK